MQRLTENKIVLVLRTTRLAHLKARFVTKTQARFYVRQLGGDFTDYESEDTHYQAAIGQARQILDGLGRVQIIQREMLPNFVFGPEDTVVVLGQDGLVANTLKYLDGQQLIGVNPDPKRWDGKLLPFTVSDLNRLIREVMRRERPIKRVTIAKVTLNTKQALYAVNDFFIGARTHVSARYHIAQGNRAENHSSSGVIVSTGLGSTGWLKSLLTGATAIAQSAGDVLANLTNMSPLEPKRPYSSKAPGFRPELRTEFPWDSEYLLFTVREPFPTRTTAATFVFGRVTPQQPLLIQSQMGEAGVIFSDGIEQDFLEFTSGTTATIGIAERKGVLVV